MPAETATLSPAMERLRKAGVALTRANRTRERAVTEVRDAIRAADAEGGNTRAQIQKTAGVARQTVYDALKPAASSTDPGDLSRPLGGDLMTPEPSA